MEQLKKGWVSVFVFIKMQLKKPITWILGILLIVVSIFLTMGTQMDARKMRVGIYGENDLARQTLSYLQKESTEMEFFQADSLESLQRQVRNKKAECGYVLTDGLKKGLQEGNAKGQILLVKSPATILDVSTNEIIYSAVIKNAGGSVAAGYLEQQGLLHEEGEEEIIKAYDQTIHSNEVFALDYQEASFSPFQKQNEDSRMLLNYHGLLAILMTILSFAGAVLWYRIRDEKGFLILRTSDEVISKVACILSFVGAVFPCALVGCLLGYGKKLDMKIFLWETFALLFFCLVLILYQLVFLGLIGKAAVFTGFLPILLFGTLFLTPVLFNLAPVVKILKYIKWLFPASYYLAMFS